MNITGSPDWAGRVILGNNLGSGCSSNPFNQFNASAVTGPGYNSLGMESGRNYLRYCPNENVDLSIVRRIAFGKIFTETRRLEFRADIFNALNTVIINAVSTTATFNTPAGMALQNNQYLSDGSLNATRLQPKNAGFGAATGAQNMRNLQLAAPLQFLRRRHLSSPTRFEGFGFSGRLSLAWGKPASIFRWSPRTLLPSLCPPALLFQPFGKEHLQQRLVRHIPSVSQNFEILDHGNWKP